MPSSSSGSRKAEVPLRVKRSTLSGRKEARNSVIRKGDRVIVRRRSPKTAEKFAWRRKVSRKAGESEDDGPEEEAVSKDDSGVAKISELKSHDGDGDAMDVEGEDRDGENVENDDGSPPDEEEVSDSSAMLDRILKLENIENEIEDAKELNEDDDGGIKLDSSNGGGMAVRIPNNENEGKLRESRYDEGDNPSGKKCTEKKTSQSSSSSRGKPTLETRTQARSATKVQSFHSCSGKKTSKSCEMVKQSNDVQTEYDEEMTSSPEKKNEGDISLTEDSPVWKKDGDKDNAPDEEEPEEQPMPNRKGKPRKYEDEDYVQKRDDKEERSENSLRRQKSRRERKIQDSGENQEDDDYNQQIDVDDYDESTKSRSSRTTSGKQRKIACTVCDRKYISGHIYAHPLLKVATCRGCAKRYNECEWPKDKDGVDEYCRWSMEGSDSLFCCDTCTRVFDSQCIKKNLGKELYDKIHASEGWECLTCNPMQLGTLKRNWTKFGEVEEEKRRRSSPASERKKGTGKYRRNIKKSRSPKTKSRKQRKIACTVCDKKYTSGYIYAHPLLSVATCQRCAERYSKCEWPKDKDGVDENCRWSMEGSDSLFCCDNCTRVFDSQCIRKNLGKDLHDKIQASENWKCLACNPMQLGPLKRDWTEYENKKKKRRRAAPASEKKKGTGKYRRNIKKVLNDEELGVETKRAMEVEEKRIELLKERRQKYKSQAENYESMKGRVCLNPFHSAAEEPIFVPPSVAVCLKKHQVEGIRFIWSNIVDHKDVKVIKQVDSSEASIGTPTKADEGKQVSEKKSKEPEKGAKEVNEYAEGGKEKELQQEASTSKMYPENNEPKPEDILKNEDKRQDPNKKQVEELKDEVRQDIETVCEGTGCILAHLMGLGKTLQSITIVQAFLASGQGKHVMIVAPVNVLANWKIEFSKWLGVDVRPNIVGMDECPKSNRDRMRTLEDWKADGGVLIIGFEMMRNLCQGKRIKSNDKDHFGTLLLQMADLVIVDEGHRIKNSKQISHVLNQIGTRRRVVLTGTPLQNNLMEYFFMIGFVRPNFLGAARDFRNRFEIPILNGQCADSNEEDLRLMRERAFVLHNKVQAFVHRRGYKDIAHELPLKKVYTLFVSLSPVQQLLYATYLKRIQRRALFQDYHALNKIWNHPRIIQLAYEDWLSSQKLKRRKKLEALFVDDGTDEEEEEEDDDHDWTSDEDKLAEREVKRDMRIEQREKRRQERLREKKEKIDKIMNPLLKNGMKADWFNEILPKAQKKSPKKEGVGDEGTLDVTLGPKFQIALELMERVIAQGEKVVVFSQSLLVLDLLEQTMGTQLGFRKYENFFRIDGSIRCKIRQNDIDEFNRKGSKQAVFLLSTKAGSLGINLVAANHAIIFDSSWNPSHDLQAVFRIYRYGQRKNVFVYRLISHNTMEQKIYERQLTKRGLALRVVDEKQVQRCFMQRDLQELYNCPFLDKDSEVAEVTHEEERELERISKEEIATREEKRLLNAMKNFEDDEEWTPDCEKKAKPEAVVAEKPSTTALKIEKPLRIEVKNDEEAERKSGKEHIATKSEDTKAISTENSVEKTNNEKNDALFKTAQAAAAAVQEGMDTESNSVFNPYESSRTEIPQGSLMWWILARFGDREQQKDALKALKKFQTQIQMEKHLNALSLMKQTRSTAHTAKKTDSKMLKRKRHECQDNQDRDNKKPSETGRSLLTRSKGGGSAKKQTRSSKRRRKIKGHEGSGSSSKQNEGNSDRTCEASHRRITRSLGRMELDQGVGTGGMEGEENARVSPPSSPLSRQKVAGTCREGDKYSGKDEILDREDDKKDKDEDRGENDEDDFEIAFSKHEKEHNEKILDAKLSLVDAAIKKEGKLKPNHWLNGFHEPIMLLEHIDTEALSEEDRKKALENFEASLDEKKMGVGLIDISAALASPIALEPPPGWPMNDRIPDIIRWGVGEIFRFLDAINMDVLKPFWHGRIVAGGQMFFLTADSPELHHLPPVMRLRFMQTLIKFVMGGNPRCTGKWSIHSTQDGRNQVFFYNKKTLESQWELPQEIRYDFGVGQQEFFRRDRMQREAMRQRELRRLYGFLRQQEMA